IPAGMMGRKTDTFEKFVKTGDAEWPLLLPMVKSAVRAMDAVQEVCRHEWDIDVPAFTATGASKRGWTTWLTGAVDKRATAIAPMVIDTLNMRPQMEHQLDAWGAFSEQIHDYTERGLQKALATDAGNSLRDIVDPYSYRQALEQPKLIMIGTNDRYWPLDALNLYWQDLIGEKYILYLPNNRHGLRDFPRMIGTLRALHQEAKGESHLPHLSWKFVPGDTSVSLRVETDRKPRKVQVWLATSKTRDFRDAHWSPQPTEKEGDAHVYDMVRPASGYSAMFGEAIYENDSFPFFLSTNVRIVASDKRADRAGEGKSL
ncbi:MAG: PhoPQ-activated protein PqaA family protein, partial [Pirellulales bacterium]